ncbi:MAG: hypothetical protein B7Z15_20860, partial [Rhizobiales bacterium 32-66-8]
ERHTGTDKELRKGLQTMDYLWDAVTGAPLEDDPMSAVARVGRRVRDYNFIRLMSQVGFAQLADTGRMLSMTGLKAALQQMPALGSVFKLAADGRLEHQLMRELEAISGIGTGRLRAQSAASEFAEDGAFLTGVDKVLHKAKQVTGDISGMSLITTTQQRMGMAAMAQHLSNVLFEGTKLDSRAMRSLGLSVDDWKAIGKQLKKHGKHGAGGRLHALNIEKWDVEMANKFGMAIHRAVRRGVQENSFGTSFPFMHSTAGKLLFQFRGFSVNAVTKQTLQGLAQRDAAAAFGLVTTTVFGGVSYAVQQSLNEPDAEKRAKNLEPGSLALKAFARSGFSSLLPGAVDSGVTLASGGSVPGIFNARTTQGLGSDFFNGIPAVDLANKSARALAAGPNAAFRDDYAYSQ